MLKAVFSDAYSNKYAHSASFNSLLRCDLFYAHKCIQLTEIYVFTTTNLKLILPNSVFVKTAFCTHCLKTKNRGTLCNVYEPPKK
jgi:hypothetical protein